MIGRNLPRRALIADTSQRNISRGRIGKEGEEWQERLWEIYEHLGPVHYGVGFKRNAAQKVTYFAAEQVEDVDEPVPTENDAVREAFERLGDFPLLMGEAVIHRNVAGECFLVGKEGIDGESWDIWSTLEYNRSRTSGRQRKQDEVDSLEPDDFVLRLWRPSPAFHELPDSPLRSVQQQCEQLLLLNEQIGAVGMSRLPAGILLMPEEMSFSRPAEDPPDTGANADGDPFMDEIIELVTTSIKDGESAARVAPAVIRGAAEYLKEIRLLTFEREMDQTFASMREELLRQIAAGLDLPAEILTGLADLNHWSLWGIDESTAKLHVDPDVLGILSDITTGYLRITLEEMGVPDVDRYLIWRDYSDLTSRPVSIEQAMKLSEMGIVRDEYVRRVANIPEEDAGDGVMRKPREKAEPAGPDNQDEGPPDSALTASAGIKLTELADIDRTLATQIIEASEAATHRALERAGAKVRAKAKKNRQLTSVIDGIDNADVTRTLGAQRIEQLQLTQDQLVPADTFDPLADRLRRLISNGNERARSALARITGRPYEPSLEEEEDRDTAITLFIAALVSAVSARLFTSSPALDPAETGEFTDEVATGQMVFELLTRAGGGTPAPDVPRGLALGQRTRAALRDAGFRTETETWEWAFLRTPKTPFEPHQSLDGLSVEDREDPRLNGYWPGDHPFCTCAFVPTVLPVAA